MHRKRFRRERPAAKFIILNAKSLVLDTQFLVFATQLLNLTSSLLTEQQQHPAERGTPQAEEYVRVSAVPATVSMFIGT